MKLKKANIDFLVGRDETTITLRDGTSRMAICEIKLTPEQLSEALSRVSHTQCEATVYEKNADKWDKELLVDKLTFEIPEYPHKQPYKEDLLHEIALRNCPEGWTPDKYYGSQSSFFKKDGKNYACVTIRKWVESEAVTPLA
jgi:hypothetical protein